MTRCGDSNKKKSDRLARRIGLFGVVYLADGGFCAENWLWTACKKRFHASGKSLLSCSVAGGEEGLVSFTGSI
ncbi:hypothetical protein D478_22868 [Brevibacillus agri BAB-2500]|nr:hypothetical protein D478_22868 [Brevibacillus agri BAB-2500]